MKHIPNLFRNGVLLSAAIVITAAGIRTALRRSADQMPEVLSVAASAAELPVIVLDAGHGEST